MNYRHILIISMIIIIAPAMFPQSGGNALHFNAGTHQYVNVPYASILRPANTVTLEAWINTDWQTIGQVAMVGNTETGGYEFDVNSVSGSYRIMFEVHRNGSYGAPSVVSSTLAAGWHHFAGTYDGRYAKLYVDGTLAATNDAGAVYPIHYSLYNNDLIIGAEAYSSSIPAGSYFSGQIDEIRVWDHVRTQSEIEDNMNQGLTGGESGLLAYYTMDEPAGSTTIIDRTGHGLTGYIHGAVHVVSSILLPVELTSFTAQSSGSTVELRWRTASEVNNHGFAVERKESDLWTQISFIPGNGSSNAVHEYSFTDHVSSNGRFSYRLKQIDHDGKFCYSSEVEVQTTVEVTSFALKQNFPNPFNPSTFIRYELAASGHVSVTVVDMLGRTVAIVANEIQDAGTYSVLFDGSRLASGVYLCTMESGGIIKINKMLLIK